MGGFALSGLLGSGKASMLPLGTLSLSFWVIAVDPAFIAGHQNIKNCGIWIDQLDHLPAVMTTNSGVLISLLLPHLIVPQTPCLPWISYATQKLMLDSCKIEKMPQKHMECFRLLLDQVYNRILLHIILKCSHVQIAFLTFTSCDNQALVGCIPIVALVVHLNVKS